MTATFRNALLLNIFWGAVAQAQTAPITLPTVSVTEQTQGAADQGYTVTRSSTALKTDIPLLDTPATVDVVPRALLSDQAATRVKDALENVVGVAPASTVGSGTGYYIRGFKDTRIYRDGLLVNAANDAFQSDLGTANVERIEVLKGPASILFGRIEPGGLINVVTKRPEADPHSMIGQSFGSYNLKRTEWDSTGQVTADGQFLYRISGSYDDADSFRTYVSHQETLLAPAVTWRPTDRLSWTVETEYYNKNYDADFGLPAIGNRPASIPTSENLGDPNTPRSNISKVHIGSEINYKLTEDWNITNRFLSTSMRNNETFLNPAPAFGTTALQDNGTLRRNAFFQGTGQDFQQTNLDLTGKFDVAGTKHQTLVGFDYLHATTDYNIQGSYKIADPALAINIFTPVYGMPSSVIAADLSKPASTRAYSYYEGNWYGAYFQDMITFGGRFHLLGGGRYDWAEGGRGRGATWSAAQANLPTVLTRDQYFSPRVGLVYDLTPTQSIYSSWTNSFAQSNGVDPITGSKRPPQTGEQFEVGAKSEFFDKRATATLALYDLTKRNISQPSPTDPTLTVLSGAQRSRGVELDFSGSLTKAISLNAAYAYTYAAVTVDNTGVQGDRIANVPRHQAHVWAKYDFADYTPLNGLSVALGLTGVGSRPGDGDTSGGGKSTFNLPGYARADAAIAYRFQVDGRNLTAQLNVKNLTDRRYYESTDEGANVGSRYSIYPGAPVTVIGGLRAEF
ncbi:MAG TPA: TonB-dependent siderophore receptor [Rhodospirillaceae bacterium]|nr:TonB-dependent siderophore receptor [Rhodospirillaceae bacterium]